MGGEIGDDDESRSLGLGWMEEDDRESQGCRKSESSLSHKEALDHFLLHRCSLHEKLFFSQTSLSFLNLLEASVMIEACGSVTASFYQQQAKKKMQGVRSSPTR